MALLRPSVDVRPGAVAFTSENDPTPRFSGLSGCSIAPRRWRRSRIPVASSPSLAVRTSARLSWARTAWCIVAKTILWKPQPSGTRLGGSTRGTSRRKVALED